MNSLRPSDPIWQHRSGSTLAQVMAWCLTAPSQHLNQCWLFIHEVSWCSSGCIIIRRSDKTRLKIASLKWHPALPGASELTHWYPVINIYSITYRIIEVCLVIQGHSEYRSLDGIQGRLVDSLAEELLACLGPGYPVTSGQGGQVDLALGRWGWVVKDLLQHAVEQGIQVISKCTQAHQYQITKHQSNIKDGA